MQASCLQEDLLKGLQTVGRAVATRTTLPITQHVLIQAEEGGLCLSATNLEIAITTRVPATVARPGALTVPARLLTEYVHTLPVGMVEMEAVDSPRGLALRSGRYRAHFHGAEADQFPPIPQVEGGTVAHIAPRRLRQGIAQVVFAAATEESRPALTGVKVELEGERFTLAAADGFRLAVRSGPLEEPVEGAVSFIVPARAMSELQRLLGDREEPVELRVAAEGTQVLFRAAGVEVVSQLIQGTFPNYAQLIPQRWNTRVVVPVADFLRATRTASIFARDGSGIIRLMAYPPAEGAPGRLVVLSRAEELGENRVELDCQVEGEPARIAFNNKYLLDALHAVDSEQVALEVTTPSSPGVFRPADNPDYVHVVMPMFVSWGDSPEG